VPPKPDRIVVNASGGAMNNIFRRSYFAAFERRHGIRVVDTSPVNFGKLRAMVESGNPEWTVTEIGGQDAMRAKELNLLEPLDLSVIDRSEYPETAKDSHVLASSAYTTALGYRTDVFPNNSHPKG
jgi:putative spermidine/putrescine transport system substrate-binding protein